MRPTAIIATRAFAPEPLPVAFRLRELALALERHGLATTVLTTRPAHRPTAAERTQADSGITRVSRARVKHDKQGQVRGYASYLSFDIPLALRLLGSRRPGVIVAEPPPTTGLITMVVAAVRRVPYAFYAADVWSDATDSVEGVPRIVRWAVRTMEKTVWRRAAVVLTISEGVDARIRELTGNASRLLMIGNGIDTETFHPDGPSAPEEGPYLVYAGTVSEWQGAEVFLEAFARVRATRPDARLLFFSEGHALEDLRNLVVEKQWEGVEFRGRVPGPTVARYLRGAAAGLSSITPGIGYDFALPTKMYAATACGTPVIHVGAPGSAAQQRIEASGLGLAPGTDPGEVSAAMLRTIVARENPDSSPWPVERLREWTLENASLRASANRAAEHMRKIALAGKHG